MEVVLQDFEFIPPTLIVPEIAQGGELIYPCSVSISFQKNTQKSKFLKSNSCQ